MDIKFIDSMGSDLIPHSTEHDYMILKIKCPRKIKDHLSGKFTLTNVDLSDKIGNRDTLDEFYISGSIKDFSQIEQKEIAEKVEHYIKYEFPVRGKENK